MKVAEIKDWYIGRFNSRPLPTLFLTIMIISLAVIIAASICSNELFMRTLGKMSQHLFMDYFWSVRDSMDHPYTIQHVIYPPLIICIYAMIGAYTMPFVDRTTSDLSVDMYNSQLPMMLFILLLLVGLMIIASLVERTTGTHLTKAEKKILIATIFLGYPFIIGIENGNNIFYAMIFVFIFLMCYDSKNRWIRLLSYVCLGIASGMKITPCIFGLLILRDRDIKGFIECVVIVAVISLGPFIFTDGSIQQLYTNITNSSIELGGSCTNIRKMMHELAVMTGNGLFDSLGWALSILATVITCLIAAFDRKMKMWKIVTLIACYLVIGLGIGTPYLMAYLLIPVCFFFAAEKDASKENLFFCIGIALVLSLTPNLVWVKVFAILAMFLYLVYESCVHLKEYHDGRSAASE